MLSIVSTRLVKAYSKIEERTSLLAPRMIKKTKLINHKH